MVTNKSPSPNGFTTNLFHHCWHFLKDEVWPLMENYRQMKGVLTTLNATFLTLVPKDDNAVDPKDFRLIYLCNVIYKDITKVMAFRPKPLNPSQFLMIKLVMLRVVK